MNTELIREPSPQRVIADGIMTVLANFEGVARRGGWPEHKTPQEFIDRIPYHEKEGKGLNPVLACLLGLIPPERQHLSAKLHRKWAPELVQQIRHEALAMKADAETTWWLAARSLEFENRTINEGTFLIQIAMLKDLMDDPEERSRRAKAHFEQLTSSFTMGLGFPSGPTPAAILGAILAGHRYGTYQGMAVLDPEETAHEGMRWHLTTYLPSLGLSDFKFKYGGLSLDKRTATTSSREEFLAMVAQTRKYFGV